MIGLGFLLGMIFGSAVSAVVTYVRLGRELSRYRAATLAVSHQLGLIITALEQAGLKVQRNQAFSPRAEIH